MAFSPKLLGKLRIDQTVLEKRMIQDVKEVFTTMAGMEDLLHIPIVVDPLSHFNDCLSALIGIGGTYTGLVSIHVSNEFAAKLTEHLLDQADEPGQDEVEDALGEIANILAGSFKLHLAQSGAEVRISTPTIVAGKKYAIHVTKKPEVTALLFDSDDDWFMVAMALESV